MRPPGENCANVMRAVWPSKTRPTGFQVRVEYSRPRPSYWPTNSRRPSGEKATEREKSL